VIGPGLLDWIRTLFAFEVSFCKICGFFFFWVWLIVRCPFVNFIKLHILILLNVFFFGLI
jgi:hypothetical protein